MINDRYKIIKKAGEGRSKVFLCRDKLRNNAEIAIKILPLKAVEEEQKGFRDEYFLLKKLNHPDIIKVFEFGSVVSMEEEDDAYRISPGSKFFTLEYFEGKELYRFENLDDEEKLIKIILRIASVLYYLHQSAFIYFDLKSENILVKENNGNPEIRFIDFGLAARLTDSDEIRGRGTAEYIAPEVLRNEKFDHRIDLYSFGIMLYRIVYGKFPFQTGDQLKIYKAHLDEEFNFPQSSYSNKITNVIKTLVSKEPDKRYFTSIGILDYFNPSKVDEFKNEWVRIPVFTGRKDIMSAISSHIEKEDDGQILVMKGNEGAGKSSLLHELDYKYSDSILISGEDNIESSLWRFLLRKVIYDGRIYPKLSTEALEQGLSILDNKSKNLVEDLRSFLLKLQRITSLFL